MLFISTYKGADKSLDRPGRKQATATEDFDLVYPIYNHNWWDISTIYIYIYITRLASNDIFSPSNKLNREVVRAKDLSAPPVISPRNIDANNRKLTATNAVLLGPENRQVVHRNINAPSRKVNVGQ